ncbi:fimbrial protein [Providencia heimbachae]|uniref:fimbrial protein n=1 Tax=Providencia heimbachae TaxID=333962 RepID=UPI0022401A7B|nr:fimbrial protein [Providencia heimbachae]
MKIYDTKVSISLFMLGMFNSCAFGENLTLIPSTITYTNPVDSVTDLSLLTGEWDASGRQQFCAYPNMTKGVIVSSSTATNYTTSLGGTNYRIFSTNIPSVGWIMGAKDTNNPNWTPLTNAETTVYPFSGSSSQAQTLGAMIQFAFVKLPGSLESGTNTFAGQKIADFKCYQNATLVQTGYIYVNTTAINVSALSCQVESSPSVSIPLGEYITTDLPAVNETFGSYTTTVELKCDSNVVPWMTITDASNASNTTNQLKLTADSTAKGVGVQVFYNNIAKTFGPDSSAKGNTNQFSIGSKTTTTGQKITIPLNFKYIRTQTAVTPGTANAAATVTFSYQ